ncbi:DNA polymerase, beta domain protein region [Candidatus Vecturithrix granuli]|uniref:DNA polymerase, beta domain protein region n=1 Tax=Vecturithrix granuli TaxID=1499967 RepID=A0A0S6W9G9_VECG1|nr:DNA polymerase, beta domain protein region [Candidatus Vecturithrix granuli]
MTIAEIIRILQSAKLDSLRQYKADLKGIFGSYSREEQRKDSDVDILVEFQPGATLFDLSGLRDFLEQKLKIKVDIVSSRALKEETKPFIHHDLMPI